MLNKHEGLLPVIIAPEAVVRRFVDAGLRPDGRAFDEARDARLGEDPTLRSSSAGTLTIGSALARIGATQALCTVGLGLGAPGEPFVKVGVSVGTSGRELSWARSVELLLADACERVVERLERWTLALSVTCLWDDGGLLDCCAFAMAAALADARLPETEERGDVVAVVRSRATPLLRGKRKDVVGLPLTCAVFGTTVLVDPTAAEERVSTLVTVLCREDDAIVKIKQHPGGPVATSPDLIRACVHHARRRAKELASLLPQ
ncbi:hypothetical protein CTAYLR_008555 [Chrysophaeum taylorii]|uniref:Ribosomal RNA-processing protein 43 n=1 Tax=Chrysophaeum taylorii TaxID=2483200 RepID=A0AAD7XI13_9STRA|nr:hypothetical protein CTAYLR_008555 [Chrysophaeum taylorii]